MAGSWWSPQAGLYPPTETRPRPYILRDGFQVLEKDTGEWQELHGCFMGTREGVTGLSLYHECPEKEWAEACLPTWQP